MNDKLTNISLVNGIYVRDWLYRKDALFRCITYHILCKSFDNTYICPNISINTEISINGINFALACCTVTKNSWNKTRFWNTFSADRNSYVTIDNVDKALWAFERPLL